MQKALAILSTILVLSFSNCVAYGQNTSKTVVVRLYEIINHRNLVISYGNGKTEIVEAPGVVGEKDQKASTEQIQQVVDRLYNEGFHLVTTTGGAHPGGPVSTFIFRRD